MVDLLAAISSCLRDRRRVPMHLREMVSHMHHRGVADLIPVGAVRWPRDMSWHQEQAIECLQQIYLACHVLPLSPAAMCTLLDWWVDFQLLHHPSVIKWRLPPSVLFVLHGRRADPVKFE